MTALLSTRAAELLLGPESFDSIFENGCIEIRSGPQPDNADLAATGTLLARITRDGGAWTPGAPQNGLQLNRSGRYALKPIEHAWTLKGIAAGTAGWARMVGNAPDPGDASLSHPRLDGTAGLIGASGVQLFLPVVEITPETAIDITYWWYAIPPIGA